MWQRFNDGRLKNKLNKTKLSKGENTCRRGGFPGPWKTSRQDQHGIWKKQFHLLFMARYTPYQFLMSLPFMMQLFALKSKRATGFTAATSKKNFLNSGGGFPLKITVTTKVWHGFVLSQVDGISSLSSKHYPLLKWESSTSYLREENSVSDAGWLSNSMFWSLKESAFFLHTPENGLTFSSLPGRGVLILTSSYIFCVCGNLHRETFYLSQREKIILGGRRKSWSCGRLGKTFPNALPPRHSLSSYLPPSSLSLTSFGFHQ